MQYRAIPCKTMQYHAIPYNTMQYHAIPCNTMQYHAIPCNTMQYYAMPCNTMHYHATPFNTMQYHAIPCNTMQYNAIPCKTMQYYTSLINADGAYHCPVGSTWPFLKIRSSRALALRYVAILDCGWNGLITGPRPRRENKLRGVLWQENCQRESFWGITTFNRCHLVQQVVIQILWMLSFLQMLPQTLSWDIFTTSQLYLTWGGCGRARNDIVRHFNFLLRRK